MQFSITIERVSADELSKVEYRYYNLNDLDLVLDSVIHFGRPTKRYNWRRQKGWSRTMQRDSDMPREEPPHDVKDEVRRRINEGMRFL